MHTVRILHYLQTSFYTVKRVAGTFLTTIFIDITHDDKMQVSFINPSKRQRCTRKRYNQHGTMSKVVLEVEILRGNRCITYDHSVIIASG